MQGIFDKEGYEFDKIKNDVNIVVVKACSFIEKAREDLLEKF